MIFIKNGIKRFFKWLKNSDDFRWQKIFEVQYLESTLGWLKSLEYFWGFEKLSDFLGNFWLTLVWVLDDVLGA